MLLLLFFQGLTAFSIGISLLLARQYKSNLVMQHQFLWLSIFGFAGSMFLWGRMVQLIYPPTIFVETIVLLALLVGGVALVMFGMSMAVESGCFTVQTQVTLFVLLLPVGFITAYVLITIFAQGNISRIVERCARALLLFPGALMAALSFFWQWHVVRKQGMGYTAHLLLLTAFSFLCYGLIAIQTSHILETSYYLQSIRLGVLVLLLFGLFSTIHVMENSRQQQLTQLTQQHKRAQRLAVSLHTQSNKHSELWLAGLIRVNQKIASMKSVDSVLTYIIYLARTLLEADTALLALRENDGTLKVKYRANKNTAEICPSETLESLLAQRVVETGHSLRSPEDGACVNKTSGDHEVSTVAVVPLQMDHDIIGVIWLGRKSNRHFTCVDLIRLKHLCDEAVVALEHATMAARIQSIAVMEERSRIAREMHDSLAQILAYLGVEMQTIEALMRGGDTAAASEQVKQARETIKVAHTDVRESILCLSTTLSGEKSLVQSLSEYIDEFSVNMGIDVILDSTLSDTVPLSPLAQNQLIRIVQESLTNVRKHARAETVRVTLNQQAQHLSVDIIDDGVGFDLQEIDGHSYGLRIMTERAESVDGSITVNTACNRGTHIHLILPLL